MFKSSTGAVPEPVTEAQAIRQLDHAQDCFDVA